MDINFNKYLDKILSKIAGWFDTFVTMLPNMLAAILIFTAFLILGRVAKKLATKLLHQTDANEMVTRLFATIVHYSVIGLGVFVILGILNLDKTVTSLLAGVGVIGLALGFAFQDIAANFVSGIILALRPPCQIGDIIEVKGFMGTVSNMNLRATIIKTFQGQAVHIPNKDVLQSPISNYTQSGKRRIDLQVGVSYGESLPKVESLVTENIQNLEGVLETEDVIFDYTEFGDSSINFNIRFWIHYPDQPGFLAMRNKAIKKIKEVFDQNDITIPFPIRTLDFGIKGGKSISEMKLNTMNGSD